jgi:hypothetical protein
MFEEEILPYHLSSSLQFCTYSKNLFIHNFYKRNKDDQIKINRVKIA